MTIVVNSDAPAQRELAANELLDQKVGEGDYFGTTSERWSFVWQLVGNRASRLGVADTANNARIVLDEGEMLRGALAKYPAFSGADSSFVIHKMELLPGEFFNRMARPSDQHPSWAPGSLPNFRDFEFPLIGTLNQIRTLVGMLEQIFQVVHPVIENLPVFGGAIRNLLILACTECEAQWRGVLSANGVVPERPNTTHYVKLCSAMRLDEYAVAFSQFPWLGNIKPFAGWDVANPTQSISWYDSYNAAKHDREGSFHRATIAAAATAISAVWVMVAAQFGDLGIRKFTDLHQYFKISQGPRWRYSQIYTFPYSVGGEEAGFHSRNYPF